MKSLIKFVVAVALFVCFMDMVSARTISVDCKMDAKGHTSMQTIEDIAPFSFRLTLNAKANTQTITVDNLSTVYNYVQGSTKDHGNRTTQMFTNKVGGDLFITMRADRVNVIVTMPNGVQYYGVCKF